MTLALCGVGGETLADARSVGCLRAAHGRVVVTSAVIVVSVNSAHGDEHVWCARWRPTGHKTVLARTSGSTTLGTCCGFSGGAQFLDRVHVAGHYVAYILREADPKADDGIDSINLIDARNGRRLVNAVNDLSLYDQEDWHSCVDGPSCLGGILDLAVNADGDLAWIVGYQTSSAIYERSLGGQTRRLDAAGGGAVANLQITRHSITWTDQGVARSANLQRNPSDLVSASDAGVGSALVAAVLCAMTTSSGTIAMSPRHSSGLDAPA